MISSVVIFSILLIIMVIAHFILRRLETDVRRQCSYNVVRAGSVGGEVRPMVQAASLANLQFESEGESVNAYEYVPYVVEGESMAANNIHTGDIVLTKDLSGDERLNLQPGKVLVFTYKREGDETQTVCYKLRQFIAYIENINDDINVDMWCKKHFIKEPEQFKVKYQKAKERAEHDSSIYLCSSTWHDNKLDYSFHSMVNLKGQVYYCIPADKLK